MTRRALLAQSAAAIVAAALPAPALPEEGPKAPAPPDRFGARDARVHDPSTIVKCGREYWLFATGAGIASWRSQDLIHWERGPRVFAEPPAWTAEAVPGFTGHFWAPDVIHVGGQFLLFYSVSTWGKTTSAIGLATSPTLDPADPKFHWADHGIVIQTGAHDNYNAIDPCVFQDGNGTLWLAFGSFWSGIKLIALDAVTGNRLASDTHVYPLAHSEAIEAACLFQRGGYYFLCVNWGLCCRGVNSTYNIRIGRSDKVTGPYRDRKGVDLLHGGGSLLVGTAGTFIGPGHAGIFSEGGEDWLSCHFYDGAQNGRSVLALRKLQYDADGWPFVAGAPK